MALCLVSQPIAKEGPLEHSADSVRIYNRLLKRRLAKAADFARAERFFSDRQFGDAHTDAHTWTSSERRRQAASADDREPLRIAERDYSATTPPIARQEPATRSVRAVGWRQSPGTDVLLAGSSGIIWYPKAGRETLGVHQPQHQRQTGDLVRRPDRGNWRTDCSCVVDGRVI